MRPVLSPYLTIVDISGRSNDKRLRRKPMFELRKHWLGLFVVVGALSLVGCGGGQFTENEVGLCADGVDNDGDGLTDCDDVVDCGPDPACVVPEAGNCADGVDNDGDQLIDCADR